MGASVIGDATRTWNGVESKDKEVFTYALLFKFGLISMYYSHLCVYDKNKRK